MSSGTPYSYMYNIEALPHSSEHKIYWGGLESIKVFRNGKWSRLIVMSVRLCYTPEGQQFVLYATRAGTFVFVVDKSHGNYAALIPRQRDTPATTAIPDYFWMCITHSTITDHPHRFRQCVGHCQCGADDHCVERPLYCCMICGDPVNETAQLCGKTRCANPFYQY